MTALRRVGEELIIGYQCSIDFSTADMLVPNIDIFAHLNRVASH